MANIRDLAHSLVGVAPVLKTALSTNLPISRSKQLWATTCLSAGQPPPQSSAQEHKEWPIFVYKNGRSRTKKNGQYLCQKNGRPNFIIEPGPRHPLAVSSVSSSQPLAASEANTHTQVFLYDRRCYDIVYLRYGAHIGTLVLRLGAVAVSQWPLPTIRARLPRINSCSSAFPVWKPMMWLTRGPRGWHSRSRWTVKMPTGLWFRT